MYCKLQPELSVTMKGDRCTQVQLEIYILKVIFKHSHNIFNLVHPCKNIHYNTNQIYEIRMLAYETPTFATKSVPDSSVSLWKE